MAATSTIVAAMAGGLLLARFDLLRPGPFLIVAAVFAYTLYAVWVQGNRRGRSERTPPGIAVAAVIAGLLGLTLGIFLGATGQLRPLGDGYEAAHVLTAVSASSSGGLVHDLTFTDDPSVGHAVDGMLSEDGTWTVRAPRGWTVLLAAFRWLGDRGPAIGVGCMAGLSVFFMFGLAAQRLRPETALLTAVALGLSPVLWLSARGLHAAVAACAISLGGLWLLVAAASEGSILQGVVAGIAVGSAALVFYEGWMLPVAAAVFLVAEEAGGWRDSLLMRRRTRRFAVAVMGGAIPVLVLAAFDLAAVGELDTVSVRFVPALAAVVGVAAALRLVWNTGVTPGFSFLREAVLAVALLLVAGAAYRLLRDPAQIDVVRRAAVGLASGDPVESLPRSATPHLVFGWLQLHLGSVTLLLGSVGLVWMGLSSVVTRDPGLRLPMIASLVAGGLTMAFPLAVPVQPDGVGVLLPIVLPGLLVGAGFVIDRWWDRRDFAIAGAVIAGAALLVVPGWRLQETAFHFPQDGAGDGVIAICDGLPPDAAVLVIEGPEAPESGRLLAPAIRSICGVPAAYTTIDLSVTDFEQFQGRAGEAGKSLYVIANEPFPLGDLGPGVAKSGDFVYESWEPTITAYPAASVVRSWPIGIAPAP